MNDEMVDIAHIYIYIYIIKVQVVTRPQVSAISVTQNKPVMFDILQTSYAKHYRSQHVKYIRIRPFKHNFHCQIQQKSSLQRLLSQASPLA